MANYTAPAAACAASMLTLLARSERPLSLADIARGVDCSKSLVFRVAKELESREFIQETTEGRFWLGVQTLEVGGAYTGQSDFSESARDVLHKLSLSTRETVNVGTLRDAELLYLAKWEGANSAVTVSHAGKRLPANCTAMGKALLARLSDRQVAERFNGTYPALTAASLSSHAALVRELNIIRQRGYAEDRGETLDGRFCMAMVLEAPLITPDGPVAISLAMGARRFEEDYDELLAALQKTAERLDAEWHGRMAMAGREHEQ